MQDIIKQYYARFNAADYEGMLALLAEDVLHEPSQGEPRPGKPLFRAFLAHMEECYKEQVIDPVIMSSADGTRAAAEFMLKGTYLKTDEGLPPARGQGYTLRVGAFFELKDGRITRVSNHYNLQHWLRQIAG
ncbi:MAG: ketosteroid isomerase-related protein [Pseudohongiellaceae bacterium]